MASGVQRREKGTDMDTIRVRYMVKDLDPAVTFYTKYLGFQVKQEAKPNFAMLSRGQLDLVLSTPFGLGGAAKPMLDGVMPNKAAGIESSSMLTTSPPRLRDFEGPTSTSGTKSHPALADLRFCWTIHRPT